MPRIRRCRYPNCHNPAFMPNHYCRKHIEHEKEYRENRLKYAKRYHQSGNSKQRQWKYNHITRYRNPIKARQNKFYHSKQWQSMRAIVFRRDYQLCQYCKAIGKLTEGNIVDHVLPVERFPEHMKDISNMVTCCARCHYWKTRFEEKYYGTGLHGKPTDNPPIKDIKLIAELSGKLRDTNARDGA